MPWSWTSRTRSRRGERYARPSRPVEESAATSTPTATFRHPSLCRDAVIWTFRRLSTRRSSLISPQNSTLTTPPNSILTGRQYLFSILDALTKLTARRRRSMRVTTSCLTSMLKSSRCSTCCAARRWSRRAWRSLRRLSSRSSRVSRRSTRRASTLSSSLRRDTKLPKIGASTRLIVASVRTMLVNRRGVPLIRSLTLARLLRATLVVSEKWPSVSLRLPASLCSLPLALSAKRSCHG